MKKSIEVLLAFTCLILWAEMAHAQSKDIFIYLKNGERIDYSVDAVQKMTFVTGPLPQYYEMNYFCRQVIPYEEVKRPSIIDSLTFFDLQGTTAFRIYPLLIQGLYFLGDSITFSPYEVNSNVIGLPLAYLNPGFHDSTNGDFHSVAWYGNRIYCSEPARYYDLDTAFNVTYDSVFTPPTGPWVEPWSLNLNERGDKIISVGSNYPDVALGWLVEDVLLAKSFKVLDSGENSSARYYPGTDSIIYYSFGSYSDHNQKPVDAGYYLYDPVQKKKIFLLPHISKLGPSEILNGFDISPDGKKLLFTSTSNTRGPWVIEYDFATHYSDTLHIVFDTGNSRDLLWLRYNHDGSKILYSNYPQNCVDGQVSDYSEIGIIDRATLTRKVLNTNPTNEGWWICLFPQWSPDERSIVYGSATVSTEPLGSVGSYQVCILKSIDK